jgi:hypothetical protein
MTSPRRFPPPWYVARLPQKSLRKNGPVTFAGQPSSIDPARNADDFGTADGFRNVSRHRDRLRTRPGLG